MPDVVSPEKRSYIMSRVRSKDTKAEVLLRSKLHRRGLRFRKNLRGVAGTPDIAFTRLRIAVFVDGDFWHGRNLDEKLSKGGFGERQSYWVPKLRGNVERDRKVDSALAQLGWRTLRFWESDVLKQPDKIADAIERTVRG